MEDWVRKTAKEVGSKQYEFINNDIKVNETVMLALIKKRKPGSGTENAKTKTKKMQDGDTSSGGEIERKKQFERQ